MNPPDLKDALQTVQAILRRVGLPALAAQMPIRLSGDLQDVRARLGTIDALLRLRPPPQATQEVLDPAWKALLKTLKENP